MRKNYVLPGAMHRSWRIAVLADASPVAAFIGGSNAHLANDN